MLITQLQERTDKMKLIYAEYNPQTNSIDLTTFYRWKKPCRIYISFFAWLFRIR